MQYLYWFLQFFGELSTSATSSLSMDSVHLVDWFLLNELIHFQKVDIWCLLSYFCPYFWIFYCLGVFGLLFIWLGLFNFLTNCSVGLWPFGWAYSLPACWHLKPFVMVLLLLLDFWLSWGFLIWFAVIGAPYLPHTLPLRTCSPSSGSVAFQSQVTVTYSVSGSPLSISDGWIKSKRCPYRNPSGGQYEVQVIRHLSNS